MLRLVERWRESGLPVYAQFDNDTRFQGTPRWPHSIGWVSRLCLALDIVPVFAPPREPGFQNQIESLNGLWQSKVWGRWQHRSLGMLQQRSTRYVIEHRLRSAARVDRAPTRRAFPSPWHFDPRAAPRGRLIFLRRTDATERLRLLGQNWLAAAYWVHRLVRCEVDFIHRHIALYALRRRQPSDQPLLATSLIIVHHFRTKNVTANCLTITEPSPLSYTYSVQRSVKRAQSIVALTASKRRMNVATKMDGARRRAGLASNAKCWSMGVTETRRSTRPPQR